MFTQSNLFHRVGPLVQQWTMRYEAKHQYFKQLATTMGNFINIPYSLSMRHQCLQAYLRTTSSLFDSEKFNVGKGNNHEKISEFIFVFLGSVVDFNETLFLEQLQQYFHHEGCIKVFRYDINN